MEIKWTDTNSIFRVDTQATASGGQVTVLRYPMLEATGLVEHCFSTRAGGASEGIFSTMNLSFTRGDDPAAVKENFQRLAEVMQVDYDKFVFTDQTHTTNIRKVTAEDAGKGLTKPRDYADIDGLITDVPGLVLSAFFADCVPLYFVDPVHRAIGLSHSGWRGTVHRMGAATVEAMQKAYGSSPEELICAIGPSICQACYEVSEDVAKAFEKEFAGNGIYPTEEFLEARGHGKFQLDLWKANEIILREAGVLPEHIAVTNLCTCCNPWLLFSHRASHGKRGNLGAFLCLK